MRKLGYGWLLGWIIAAQAWGQVPETPLNLNSLKRLISDRNITSIEGLLQALPNDYKQSYVFLYQSRSLQTASPEYPRTVLFGKDAKLVLSFEGNPTYPRFQNIEMIEWNPQESKFQFHSMDFNPSARTPPRITENMLMCTGCHRTDARPNWDTFNFWPGVYGSISRDGKSSVRRGLQEYENYANFLATNRNRGRYRYLPKNPNDLGHFKGELFFVGNGENLDPAASLTERFADLNFKRVLRILKNHPQYEKFKYLLAYSIRCAGTGELDQIVPPGPMNFADYVRFIYESRSTRELGARVERLNGFNDNGGFDDRTPVAFDSVQVPGPHFSDPLVLQKFFYVLYRVGVDASDFPLVFEKGNYSMATPNGTSRRVEKLVEQLLVDSELPPAIATCSNLQEKIRSH